MSELHKHGNKNQSDDLHSLLNELNALRREVSGMRAGVASEVLKTIGYSQTASGVSVSFSSGTRSAKPTTIAGDLFIGKNLIMTDTGSIKIDKAGEGANGYVLNAAGIFGYDSILGQTFSLPTDGSKPTFASGIIREVEFEIYTSGVIRTSATVGDGSINSGGVLINNTGIYGLGASQEPATANTRIIAATGNLYAQNAIISGSIDITNPADIDASELTNALVDENGKLVLPDVPSGSGLYLGTDHMGFYNGSAWKTFTDNSGNFYLGGTSGKLVWNAGTDSLSITGSITLENTISSSNISDVDSYSSGQDLQSLSTLNYDTPSGSGLFLDATHLGYYASSAWKTYMDNSGNFYLGGTSGALTWVAGSNALTITNGTITGGTVQTGTTNQRVVMASSVLTFYDASGTNSGSLDGYSGRLRSSSGLYMGSSGSIYQLSASGTSATSYDYTGMTFQLTSSLLYSKLNYQSLQFGTSTSYDVNLYRGGANLLQTDDSFTIGGDLSVTGSYGLSAGDIPDLSGTYLVASHTTTYNHANYNTAYGWGNHASAGYITSAYNSLVADNNIGTGASQVAAGNHTHGSHSNSISFVDNDGFDITITCSNGIVTLLSKT